MYGVRIAECSDETGFGAKLAPNVFTHAIEGERK
jgi:hypothetical protein